MIYCVMLYDLILCCCKSVCVCVCVRFVCAWFVCKVLCEGVLLVCLWLCVFCWCALFDVSRVCAECVTSGWCMVCWCVNKVWCFVYLFWAV